MARNVKFIAAACGVALLASGAYFAFKQDGAREATVPATAPIGVKKAVAVTLPDGEQVEVNVPCWSGTRGDDTALSSELPDTTNCFLLKQGGVDYVNLKGDNAPDFLLVSAGSATIQLGGGDDLVEIAGHFDVDIDAGGGEDRIYLPGLEIADLNFKIDGSDIVLSGKRGTIRLRNQFAAKDAAPIAELLFENHTMTRSELRLKATQGQGTSGDDDITGTPGNDDIWPGRGNDTVSALAGDDTIHYEGGDDLIRGALDGLGNDTLTLTQFASADVSIHHSHDGRDIVIETPVGAVTLQFQDFFPVGDKKTNIETVVFSDGPVNDAQLRAMATSGDKAADRTK